MKKYMIVIPLLIASNAFAGALVIGETAFQSELPVVFPDGTTQITAAQYFVCPAGQACVTGTPGPMGPAGFNGSDGSTGPQGPQGDAGLMGPAGVDGLTGAVGPVGPVGPAGPVGSAGPAGPMPSFTVNSLEDGLTSPEIIKMGSPAEPLLVFHNFRGPVGLTGPAGATGPVGPAGPAGSGSSLPWNFSIRNMSTTDFQPVWLRQGSTWTDYNIPFDLTIMKNEVDSKLRVSWTDNIGVFGSAWCSVGLFLDADIIPICAGSWSGVSANSVFNQQQISCLVSAVSAGNHQLTVKHRSQYCVYGNYAFDAEGYNRKLTVEEVY